MTPPYFAFSWLSPLWRGPGPSFEQTWSSFTQGWCVPSLIEFGQLVLEKKTFNIFQCNFTLLLLSPLGEGQSPSFEQTWMPYPQGWFMSSLVKIGPVVLEKKIFKWPHPFLHFYNYLPLEDWLIICGFMSRSRIFHLYGDVTITGEGLQNLGLCSALRAFEQGRIIIMPHLLWDGTSVFLRRTVPFSYLLRHTRGCGEPILTRILTGTHLVASYYTNECGVPVLTRVITDLLSVAS